jgi:alkanesulfonate monooxygenase SsuD/methylene tetrahydromethanopterin reductase-like flavin-dependent oxidoreductase (luciferase family)
MRYGHPPLFGVVLTPDADDPERTVELAVHAEKAGLDLVSVSDHPYHPGFMDAWTLLSWIAARTQTVSLMPNVANLPLRPPAGLARAAATLDLLSGGRVELGVGAGGHGHAIHSEGGSAVTLAERVSAFAEAVTIIRALTTSGPPVTLDGTYHRVYEAVPGPAHPHPIGLWIGGVGPRMLRLVGRLGDGWIPSATRIPPDGLDAANARIDQAAHDAGRQPGDIRRLYNIPAAHGAHTRSCAGHLTDIALRHGISGFLLLTDDRDTIAGFGGDTAAAVRDRLR